jgi:hypothetical protein
MSQKAFADNNAILRFDNIKRFLFSKFDSYESEGLSCEDEFWNSKEIHAATRRSTPLGGLQA